MRVCYKMSVALPSCKKRRIDDEQDRYNSGSKSALVILLCP